MNENKPGSATERQARNLLRGRFETPRERDQRLLAELAAAEKLVKEQIVRDRSTKRDAASTLQARQLQAPLAGRGGYEEEDE